MLKIKNYFKKTINKIRFKQKSSSEEFVNYLMNKGVQIGEDVIFYSPLNTLVDEQYPWQITIGNHVRITEGVKILTHDFSWSVLKEIDCGYGKGTILGASGKVNIGNNVFIGMNSIILRGVNIGDNVIIGAGSIVSRDCESNGVYAGNPAKKIMDINEYYKKRLDAQVSEAKNLALDYFYRYKTLPKKEIFYEYFFLFESNLNLPDKFIEQMELGGTKNESFNHIITGNNVFNNFDSFLDYVFKDIEEN